MKTKTAFLVLYILLNITCISNLVISGPKFTIKNLEGEKEIFEISKKGLNDYSSDIEKFKRDFEEIASPCEDPIKIDEGVWKCKDGRIISTKNKKIEKLLDKTFNNNDE